MSIPFLPPQPPPPNLYAAIDMGTNSFKMLIVRTDPISGKFLAVDHLKHQVLLGQSQPSILSPDSQLRAISALHSPSPFPSQPSISLESQLRAISALQDFTQSLKSRHVTDFRFVATSAVREAANRDEFLLRIRDSVGVDVDVLSGEEEGKYVYLGILQFLPCFDRVVLCVDIGGGSTEIVIGKNGKVIYCVSLKLGHVVLTDRFMGNGDVLSMRDYIRGVIEECKVSEEVSKLGYEIVVGSSGTIRAVEKAVFCGYKYEVVNDSLFSDEIRRDWRFSKEDLHNVVEKLCGEEDGSKRKDFFKRRSEFIIAGVVLLEEIFEALGIEEMEVSGYALGEGVIAERLGVVCEDYDLNANARWRSVMRLATRFNNTKRMRYATQCSCIAKEIFDGLRKYNEFVNNQNKSSVSLDEKDFEYLEAACLLQSIGYFSGKKGYHKRSCHIIMNGDHLHGYNTDEIKLIALLARHHRKKFPKFSHASLKEFPKEVKQKFTILCVIIRISVIIAQYQSINLEAPIEFSHTDDGFKLVLDQIKEQLPGTNELSSDEFEAELNKEFEHFKTVCGQKISVVVHSISSESREL